VSSRYTLPHSRREKIVTKCFAPLFTFLFDNSRLATRQKVESSRHLIHSNSLAKLYNPKLGLMRDLIAPNG
jgi:hypothetical protein